MRGATASFFQSSHSMNRDSSTLIYY